jgi:hypothetical protein
MKRELVEDEKMVKKNETYASDGTGAARDRDRGPGLGAVLLDSTNAMTQSRHQPEALVPFFRLGPHGELVADRV